MRGTAPKGLGLAAAMFLLVGSGAATASPGDFDTSFSGDGLAITDLGYATGTTDIAMDSQGRIVAVGHSEGSSTSDLDMTVVRYTTDGSLDTSFSGDGIAKTDLLGGQYPDIALGVTVDAQDRPVVVGEAYDGTAFEFAVARYLESGALDTSFSDGDGSNGVFARDINNDDEADFANAVTIDSSGRIVAAGARELNGGSEANFAVTRLLDTGDPDTTLDGNGTLNTSVVAGMGYDEGKGVAIDSAGRIVVGGETDVGTNDDMAVMRFLPADGDEDDSFDGDGIKTLDFSGQGDTAYDLAIASGDRVVLGGVANNNDDMAIARLSSTGAPDTAFSTDGKATLHLGTSAQGYGLALDAEGRAVLAGRRLDADYSVLVARFSDSGALDTAFGGDGNVNFTIPGASSSSATAVRIDPTSQKVLVGITGGTVFNQDFTVARLEGVPRCDGKVPTIAGSSAAQTLKGTGKVDVIWGGAGKDTIKGFAGKDRVCGDDGADKVTGGDGADRLRGGDGKDNLSGGGSADKLYGEASADRLNGDKGNDSLNAGNGNDKLFGGAGKDKLFGQKGKDRLTGGKGRDKLKGGPGRDHQKQ